MKTNKPINSLHFRALRREKGLTLQDVANAAELSSTTDVYLFEIGAIVPYQIQQKIVQALARLTGQPYTLSDFVSVPEEQPTVVIYTPNWSHRRGA